MTQPTRPADRYTPLYFLSSVGAGGLAVTFFMYLMFWVPHPDAPVPVFNDILAAWSTGTPPRQIAIVIAMTGIAVFAFLNIKALLWNLAAFAEFARTEAYTALRQSNAEATLLARPLALAMSVNALFIVGLVFVPDLWNIVEYLFPAAMLAFVLIAGLALREIGVFLGRILSSGGAFDMTQHNSFGQLLPAFALAMTGVGLAAPAAMSTNPTTVGVALILSTFLATASTIYAAIALITAMSSMLHHGTAKEAAPTLMIVVPLMTILGILIMRQDHGLHTTFGGHTTTADTLMFLARFVSVQLLFLALGLVVMTRQGYFKSFVFGHKTSPGSYALVCPGVAFQVLMFFFINKGLVAAQIIDKFSPAYWGLTAVALTAQAAMVLLVFRLNRQHFGRPRSTAAVPAE
ncbi:TsoY family (seleno)protein [Pseudooceanicola sp. C21-150M6]|uniref:TsoY family (seleno)protein n=1 Tax=Pseudooceanicola sp. C21-150M6 TaxID=3434355 RepID=UPI003D7F879F